MALPWPSVLIAPQPIRSASVTPSELILIPLAIGALLFGGVTWIVWKKDRVRPVNKCPKCGYDLQDRKRDGCPECGWNTNRPVKRL